VTPIDPTLAQIQAYERDGYLIVENWLSEDEVERTRERFHACFEHEWETGLAPDEVNYTPGVTPPERTRQLCNVWKADRWLAHITLAERNARFAAKLAGEPGMRLLQDNMIWKPPSGKALLAHQDAAYVPFLEPPNMTTCWMALDETAADTGTIYYARGSHAWGRLPTGDTFHAPDDWLGWMNEVRPPEIEAEMVPIEVPPGGAAFHHGLCFHGSPPNERPDADRRAIISHMVTTDTTWHPTARHPLYSRYMRPGVLEMDEVYFPIMWREDSYRTPYIESHFAAAA
jgi:ectoine hydroxylase-related dioxygenase (phytanoyl-CoA dioxygenase family)